jgi:hypothetical protein
VTFSSTGLPASVASSDNGPGGNLAGILTFGDTGGALTVEFPTPQTSVAFFYVVDTDVPGTTFKVTSDTGIDVQVTTDTEFGGFVARVYTVSASPGTTPFSSITVEIPQYAYFFSRLTCLAQLCEAPTRVVGNPPDPSDALKKGWKKLKPTAL